MESLLLCFSVFANMSLVSCDIMSHMMMNKHVIFDLKYFFILVFTFSPGLPEP